MEHFWYPRYLENNKKWGQPLGGLITIGVINQRIGERTQLDIKWPSWFLLDIF